MSLTLLDAKKWIISFPPLDSGTGYRSRLLCFHWAGGSGQAFRPWSKILKDNQIDVCAVMLPGRFGRAKEDLIPNVEHIVEYIYQSLSILSYLDDNQPPLIFFGHSYGGIIAYELAQVISQRNSKPIAHLIISSTNNPEVLTRKSLSLPLSFSLSPSSIKLFHLLSDEKLLEEVIHHGGLPVGVHLDILKHMLPIIRSDYQGLETYSTLNLWTTNSMELTEMNDLPLAPERRRQYPGRMTILGSDSDPGDVTISSLNGWKYYCQNSDDNCSVILFPNGSHFYFQDSHLSQQVIDRIREICLNPERRIESTAVSDSTN